jgi:hypothetical protein
MILQVELQWVVGLLFTIVGAFWGVAKMLIAQSQRHIDMQFESVTKTLREQGEGTRHVERELMALKAELPQRFVMREDHVRVNATLQVSIDQLRFTVERALLETKGKP